MLHARTGVVPRRLLVPVLLLGISTAGLSGLVALSPEPAATEPDVVAYSQSRPLPLLVPEETDGEQAVARASRGRRQSEAESAARATAAQAEAEAR